MKRNPGREGLSRRQVLQGLGGFSLALPILPSLFPASARAQVANAPKRFVAICTYDGYYESVYYPSVDANQQFASDVMYRPLSDIPGGISALLGTQLDSLRPKMNIYRGLDIPGSVGHSAANMLCGAARVVFGDDAPLDLLGTSCSMDVVLAKSKSFYPQRPLFEALRGQEPSYNYSMSFDRSATNQTVRIPYAQTPTAMFQQVFGSSISNPQTQQAFKSKRVMIGDLVLESYQKLRNGRRIAMEDKVTLDNFITRLQELNGKLNATQTSAEACTGKPSLRPLSSGYWDSMTETDHANFFSNYIDLMVSAMACDLTRTSIISIRLHGHDHALSHADPKNSANQAQYIANTQKHIKIVREFASKMDGIVEANGKTMLDNSILFWGSEDSNGAPHSCLSMPAITLGSAAGNIKTGYYVDYRQRPFVAHPDGQNLGRSYSQLLITIMRALGLQPSEYLQYGDGGGFGTFNKNAPYTNQKYYPYEAQRNNTLPFISLV